MYWKCYTFEYNGGSWSKYEYFEYDSLVQELVIKNRIVRSLEEFEKYYDKNKKL